MKKAIITGLALSMFLASCEKEEINSTSNTNNTDTEEVQESLEDQLKEFAPESENFTVNSESVITITTANGNLISFPANAFVDQEGNPVTGNVDIAITEVMEISDMILSGMMTNSDQGILSSQGEFNVVVTQNGVELELADGTTFTISNPNEEINEDITGWEWNDEANNNEGEWVQNESEENNECDRYLKILGKTKEAAPTEMVGLAEELQNILELNIENKTDYSLDRSHEFAASLVKDDTLEYSYFDLVYTPEIKAWWINANQSVRFGLNNKEVDVNEYWEDIKNIDYTDSIYSQNCQVYLTKNNLEISFHLDEDKISIDFSSLNWCNIDRLLSEYGTLYNCKLNGNIPKNAKIACVFKELNGVIKCSYIENKFIADRLPAELDVDFLIFFEENGKYKCGIQTIKAAQEMEFDTSHLNSFETLEELTEEIKRLTK